MDAREEIRRRAEKSRRQKEAQEEEEPQEGIGVRRTAEPEPAAPARSPGGNRGAVSNGREMQAREDKRAVGALAQAEELMAESVRRQAAAFVPDAVSTLGAFAMGHDVNGVEPAAPTVAKAARDIIEFAGGRPETRDPRTTDPSQQVQIFIQKFGDDDYIEVNPSFDAEDPASKLVEAETMANSVSIEVEYAEDDSGEAS